MQQIHRELKYGNRPYYGEIMGRIAGREIRESGGAQFDLIVPIPLHRSRFHDRGYNQSETIALGIQSILEMPLDASALIRTRRTRSQTGLSMSSRLENVENAFGVGRNPVPVGANVLLVDDIITTGSTVCSAARVLKESGVRSVTVAGVGFARV
ncbi:MAG: ComF family protein [Bacteroidetes bacterium]|nr:ComF family protein [Bacteroidota bacterium]